MKPSLRVQSIAVILAIFATVLAPAWQRDVNAQAGPQTFESDPVIAGGVNGPVWITELIGDELWIGGEFTSVRNAPFGDPELLTTNLAVININTGLVVQKSFDFDGPVYGIEYADGNVWVVGNFDNLNGQRARNVVAIDLQTNTRNNAFVAESNAQLRDVEWHQGWLYLGGNLSQYNGAGVNKVIRVDPSTGVLDTSWAPAVTLWVEALDASGDLLLAVERANVSRAETKVISIPLGVKLNGLDTLASNDRGMWDAKFSPDGQFVYTAELRNVIRKFTVDDFEQWGSLAADGDMQAVAATDSVVFAGFHEGWLGNEDRRIVAFNPATGTEDFTWYVEMNSYWGVRDIQIYDQGMVAAGEFSNVNGINARRIAIFRPNGGWIPAEPIFPPDPEVTLGDVNCDDQASILDALFIAQYLAGLREASTTCPLAPGTLNITGGDVRGDGDVDIIDALFIAQCETGVANVLCPL